MKLLNTLLGLFKIFLPSSHPDLKQIADQYQQQLCQKPFIYRFETGKSNRITAEVSFTENGFCHLFSIGSIVKGCVADEEEYAGRKGWNNIQKGNITFESLKRMNPEQFEYYHPEHLMLDELVETAQNPQAVLFDKSKLPNSQLQADILLYKIFGDQTVHIALSQKEGEWFVRSYFVRHNAKDKQYPTKYIAGMTPLKVKVLSKNA